MIKGYFWGMICDRANGLKSFTDSSILLFIETNIWILVESSDFTLKLINQKKMFWDIILSLAGFIVASYLQGSCRGPLLETSEESVKRQKI